MCLLTAQVVEIDLVLVLGLIGVPFYAWIVGFFEVVEGYQVWLIVF